MGKVGRKAAMDAQVPPPVVEAEPCALCGRPLGGERTMHHVVPKSRGGTDTVALHPICHQAIHANVTNSELARLYPTIESLLGRDDIAAFLRWIADKPADFHATTKKAKK